VYCGDFFWIYHPTPHPFSLASLFVSVLFSPPIFLKSVNRKIKWQYNFTHCYFSFESFVAVYRIILASYSYVTVNRALLTWELTAVGFFRIVCTSLPWTNKIKGTINQWARNVCFYSDKKQKLLTAMFAEWRDPPGNWIHTY
jgi:hypothetical protein